MNLYSQIALASLRRVCVCTPMRVCVCVWTVCPTQREAVPDDYSRVDPEHKLIYRFVRTLFSAAQLTAECAIVTLVSLSLYKAVVYTLYWAEFNKGFSLVQNAL